MRSEEATHVGADDSFNDIGTILTVAEEWEDARGRPLEISPVRSVVGAGGGMSAFRLDFIANKSLLLRVAQAVQLRERGCIRSSMVRELEDRGAGDGPNRVESLERKT